MITIAPREVHLHKSRCHLSLTRRHDANRPCQWEELSAECRVQLEGSDVDASVSWTPEELYRLFLDLCKLSESYDDEVLVRAGQVSVRLTKESSAAKRALAPTRPGVGAPLETDLELSEAELAKLIRSLRDLIRSVTRS